jgi:hypothetical protein
MKTLTAKDLTEGQTVALHCFQHNWQDRVGTVTKITPTGQVVITVLSDGNSPTRDYRFNARGEQIGERFNKFHMVHEAIWLLYKDAVEKRRAACQKMHLAFSGKTFGKYNDIKYWQEEITNLETLIADAREAIAAVELAEAALHAAEENEKK